MDLLSLCTHYSGEQQIRNSRFRMKHVPINGPVLQRKSTTGALALAVDQWHRQLEECNDICTVFFDYQKAFDTVPHCHLLFQLETLGVNTCNQEKVPRYQQSIYNQQNVPRYQQSVQLAKRTEIPTKCTTRKRYQDTSKVYTRKT